MISSELGKEAIKKELPLIPKLPGVYRMLNSKNEILYVGKAKNLPNRLKSYIVEKNHIIRIERMLSQTKKIEITTTSNESEALLLEANLIKKFKPKFNILLRDDKSFPFIFIGNKDKWPQIKRHRGKKTKEGFYFGPFASAGSANWTIKMIQKIFHLRVCDDTVFKNRERPCILYQIKRCSGPCVGYIKKEESKLGELLDPVADKIIVATALILLVMDGTIKNYEVIAAIIILTREILISGLREFLAKGKINLPVSSLAKAKTFLQMIAISALLTGETGNKIINFQDYNAQTIGIILLWLSAFLTLYTGYEYLRKGIDHAISEDEKN